MRIDFYVLQSSSVEERLHFAVRLVEKAWLQNCSAVVLTADGTTADALDALLWRFKPESFIPHSRTDATAPVFIGTDAGLLPLRELLINLGPSLPAEVERFQRLAEIVIQTPEVLEPTRFRYGRYREMGYQVNTHKLAT
ncbi:MAG: DNA polymerase III subunit chi [Cellvibrionaceae bacterium]|nr:DNA polymerase III subunit chi [Cellvibrionaceae bacterium]